MSFKFSENPNMPEKEKEARIKLYGGIHLLFRLIAEVHANKKMAEAKPGTLSRMEVVQMAKDVKDYWKRFYKIDSLTDLTIPELKNLRKLMQKRLELLKILVLKEK